MIFKAIFFFFLQQTAWAAGGGGVADLKWPAVNFVLLITLLFWKAKKPLQAALERNYQEVSSSAEMAAIKDKEGQVRLESYQKKMETLDDERNKIMNEARRDAERYAQKVQEETASYIKRIKSDVASKMAQEKTALTREIVCELIDDVIVRTKKAIGEKEKSVSLVSKKLLAQI